MTTAERIKRAVQLDELVARLDFAPNRAGYISCPAHKDSTPSLKIYGGDRGWFCFGCQQGGTVIDFYMHTLGVDLSIALKELGDLYGIDTDSEPSRSEVLHMHVYRERKAELAKRQEAKDNLYKDMIRIRDTLRRDYDPDEPMPDDLIEACQQRAHAEYKWEEVRDDER